jgi:hypothetical protein
MNYFKLDLPTNPLNDTFVPSTNNGEGWHIYKNVEHVLNAQVLDCFDKLGLVPDMVVVFGSDNPHRTAGFLHVDLGWHDRMWKPMPCAVNWEINQTTSVLEWHDTKDYTEIWPTNIPANLSYPDNYLQGISFVKTTVPDCIVITEENIISNTLIESVTLTNNSPVLFNTSRPHSVIYQTRDAKRFMVSVRFSFSQIASWEKAIEIFRNVIVDA